MAELSTVLTAAGGLKVYIQEYDSNLTYPQATPPGDMPCILITNNSSSGNHEGVYFYYTFGGNNFVLDGTAWFNVSGS